MRYAVVSSLILMSSPAIAGWQSTSWGMTPEQVTAVSPRQVGPYSDSKLDTPTDTVRLVTTHEAMGFSFSVAMLFNRQTNGLSQVRLLLNDEAQCSALMGSLSQVYGLPEARAARGFARWRDEPSGNLISLQPLGGCWLVYSPIPPKGSSGL